MRSWLAMMGEVKDAVHLSQGERSAAQAAG